MTANDEAGQPAGGSQAVEVLVLDTETEYLVELLDRIDRSTDELAVEACRTVDEAIRRLEEGGIDCLVSTYDPGRAEGLELLDYVREASVDVPVVMLLAQETTVIDGRNLVADVDSVFLRDEATETNLLGPHLVNVVEQQRASAVAERRGRVRELMSRVARDVAGADDPGAVEEAVCERLADASAFDAGWIAALEDGDLAVRALTEDEREAVPGVGADGPLPSLVDAAYRAVSDDQPRMTDVDDGSYAVVPITAEEDDPRALAVHADSEVAFREPEVDLLEELGNTLGRTLDAVATRRALESKVDDLAMLEAMIDDLAVPVVVYGPNGFVERTNDAFAELLDLAREELEDAAVWSLLPPLEASTYEAFWESLSPGETDLALATVGGEQRQLVTTRVVVDGEPYCVTLLVEPAEVPDETFARTISYEFRHWLELAGEAADEARERGDPERLALVDELVDRMRSAIETELDAAAGEGAPATGELEPVGIGSTARTAWNHVLGEAGSHEVRGSHAVYAHRGLLLRLFEHCFRTLLAYAEEATAVDVGLTPEGFYVEDDGSGPPHGERAYADGWRDAPTDAAAGAGLLVADRVADRLGWSFAVTENDAGGTRLAVSGVEWAPPPDADEGEGEVDDPDADRLPDVDREPGDETVGPGPGTAGNSEQPP